MADRPRIAVFRPDDERIETAVERLAALGATAVPDPMLAVEPTGATPAEAPHVVFTSKTGAEIVDRQGWTPAGAVHAIGPKTAQALRDRGYDVAVVPEEYSSVGLVRALRGRVAGDRVAVARSDHGSPVLLDGLRSAGADVTETVLYRLTRPPEAGDSAEVAAQGELDGACFTSSLTVRHFLGAAAERGVREPAVAGLADGVVGCLGEPTQTAAREAGVRVDVVPREATFDALARAVVGRFGD